jgi:hypothetical protein
MLNFQLTSKNITFKVARSGATEDSERILELQGDENASAMTLAFAKETRVLIVPPSRAPRKRVAV